MSSKLMGYKRFTSKKNGKSFCVAELVSDFSQRDLAAGCVGKKVEEVFLPEDQYDYLKPEHIGKDVILDYELSGNRAYLVNVTVK